MIHVYARTQKQAITWARQQNYQPRQIYAFGNRSPYIAHSRYRDGDRVVILGEVSHEVTAIVERCAAKASLPIERIELPAERPSLRT